MIMKNNKKEKKVKIIESDCIKSNAYLGVHECKCTYNYIYIFLMHVYYCKIGTNGKMRRYSAS